MNISRKMETTINSSKEIKDKSNKESVTKRGRAVAILKQGKTRERRDMKGMERERERKKKSKRKGSKKKETEWEKYQRRDTWTQCQVTTL